MYDKILFFLSIILEMIKDLCFWLIPFYILGISINTGLGIFVIIFVILINILIVRGKIEDRRILNKKIFDKNSKTMDD